jgi:hypothetical protein
MGNTPPTQEINMSYKIAIADRFSGVFERHTAENKKAATEKVREVMRGWMEKGDHLVSREIEDGVTGYFIRDYRHEELDIFAAFKKA